MGRLLSASESGAAASMPFGNGIVRLFKSSGTFIVPSGIRQLRVSVLGGGAGGLAAVQGGNNINWYPNFGGAGGGFACKTIDVTPGDSFAYVVGAGGAGMRVYSGNVILTTATSGGTSSFGSVLSATGGGVAAPSASAGGRIVGTPGQGVGGDINHSGGRSGIIQASCIGLAGAVQTFTMPHALGGGAGGHFYGSGGSGGDLVTIDNSTAGSTPYQVIGAATGGGAAGGGNGGAVRGFSGLADLVWASGGGGVGGNAGTPANGYITTCYGGIGAGAESFSGEDASAVLALPGWHVLLPLLGGGQHVTRSATQWAAASAPARGAGTCGVLALATLAASISAANALLIGGGGGAVHLTSTDGFGATGGAGGYGGGGGAACAGMGLNIYSTGGAGGQGLILVEY